MSIFGIFKESKSEGIFQLLIPSGVGLGIVGCFETEEEARAHKYSSHPDAVIVWIPGAIMRTYSEQQ